MKKRSKKSEEFVQLSSRKPRLFKYDTRQQKIIPIEPPQELIVQICLNMRDVVRRLADPRSKSAFVTLIGKVVPYLSVMTYKGTLGQLINLVSKPDIWIALIDYRVDGQSKGTRNTLFLSCFLL